MCADACEAAGLEVPELPGRACGTGCAELLPAEAGLLNPVDMIATATAEHYRRDDPRARRLGRDRRADRDLHPAAAHPSRGRRRPRSREAVEEMPREIPVQAVFMSPSGPRRDLGRRGPDAPLSRGRGSGARQGDAPRRLARAARPQEPPTSRTCDADEAAALIAEALDGGDEWMAHGADARACSTATGSRSPTGGWQPIPTRPPPEPRRTKLGGRVALKAQGPGLLHKTEIGAVRGRARPEAPR